MRVPKRSRKNRNKFETNRENREELQVFQELVTLQENLKYYTESTDFLRDCIDREILNDYLVNTLIKYVSKCRYNVGELHEKYLIYERNFLDKVVYFIKIKIS